ncbi:MAG: small, acid-soluble spore protein, alpha/beta type, partial [Peptococcaceae bacterium]|nr:small, acid-soluble spore protein, alpha/beta type [Peptococcaceae bacterium]
GSVGGEMTKRMIQLAEQQLQSGTRIPPGGGMMR